MQSISRAPGKRVNGGMQGRVATIPNPDRVGEQALSRQGQTAFEPVRVALIGCGRWAREAYLPALPRVRHLLEVVAVGTSHPVTARQAGATLGARAFVGHESVLRLGEVEAVLNLTSRDAAAISLAALQAGMHVCSEVAVDRMGEALVAEARARDLIVQFCEWPYAYQPIHRELERLLAGWRSLEPGPRAVCASWGWTPDQAWYQLEALAGPVLRLCAIGNPVGKPQAALLEFQNGDTGSLTTWGRGTVGLHDHVRFEFSHPSGVLRRDGARVTFTGPAGARLLPAGTLDFPLYDWHDDYVTMLADYAHCVRSGEAPRFGIASYLRSQRLEAAAVASRRRGGVWVEVGEGDEAR